MTADDFDIRYEEALNRIFSKIYDCRAQETLKEVYRERLKLYDLALPAGFRIPDPKEQKDVKCECGSDAAGSPYHSAWCPKDEKGPTSKQTPPEDML